MTVDKGDYLMTDRGRKFSFAAGVLLLIMCLTFVYEWLIEPLKNHAYGYKESSYADYMKELYTGQNTKRYELALTFLVVALAVLTIAMFRQNVLMFLIGAVIDTGLIVSELKFGREYWDIPSEWNNQYRLAYIGTYIIPLVLMVLLIAMGVTMLLKKKFAKLFAYPVIGLACVGFLLELLLDIGPCIWDTWQGGYTWLSLSFSAFARTNAMQLTLVTTPISYFTRAGIAVLIALWGIGRCKDFASKNEGTNSVA